MSICPMVSLDSSIRVGNNTLGSVRPLYARGMSMSLRMSLFFLIQKKTLSLVEKNLTTCVIYAILVNVMEFISSHIAW